MPEGAEQLENPSDKSTGRPHDGGRSALTGFLYQTVGVLGMTALAHSGNEDPSELTTILELVHKGEIWPEELDQDAVIQVLGLGTGDEYVLVQFKYSRLASPPDIRPLELQEIVDRLIASAERAQRQASQVTRYVLITNRRPGPG